MKEWEGEKGGSERVKEGWRCWRKEKQNSAWKTQGTMKQKFRKKMGWVKQIGRRANCRAAGCKIIGGMLLFSFSTSIYRSCYRNRPKLARLFYKRSPVLQVVTDRPDSFTGRRVGAWLVMTQKNLPAFVTVAVRRPPLHLSCQDKSLLVPTSWSYFGSSISHARFDISELAQSDMFSIFCVFSISGWLMTAEDGVSRISFNCFYPNKDQDRCCHHHNGLSNPM